MTYDASSIRVVDDFSHQRFDWVRAHAWAAEFKTPVDWLLRAIRACREAGVNPDYIHRRYLLMDGTPLDPTVDEAMRALMFRRFAAG